MGTNYELTGEEKTIIFLFVLFFLDEVVAVKMIMQQYRCRFGAK